jgi:fido (protein-threonine AMPylation protein)
MTCPEWNAEIPPGQQRDFAEGVRQALVWVTESAAQELLSTRTFRLWHLALFRKCVPVDYYAGNFRQDDAARPCLGLNVKVGPNPGADFSTVLVRMEKLASDLRISISRTELHWLFLNRSDRASRLAAIIATALGELIRIHPFINGNGRISRLLWRWGYQRFGVPAQVRIAPRPDPPYASIMDASMQGNDSLLALEILKYMARHPPDRST